MERQEKDYIFTVYRTVQQSVQVTVTSDRELYGKDKLTQEEVRKEMDYLYNAAEYQAGELPDGDWKIEEVDTIYALFEAMED
tara:strand:+ start:84 stop:329 length:246 start_codon:yes stop_codon:yes gene_type:complete